MATKHLTVDQCQVLHKTWPDNCCLCRVNAEKADLLSRVERLEAALREIREEADGCRYKDEGFRCFARDIADEALEESDGE